METGPATDISWQLPEQVICIELSGCCYETQGGFALKSYNEAKINPAFFDDSKLALLKFKIEKVIWKKNCLRFVSSLVQATSL